jgi:hypothetical protein
MLSTTIFVIVGKNDKPIFEIEMGEPRKTGNEHLNQFVIHSALDIVDETQWANPGLHLKVVDQYKNLQVCDNFQFIALHCLSLNLTSRCRVSSRLAM